MNMLGLTSSVLIALVACYWKFFLVSYIHESFVCISSAKQIMSILRILCYNDSLVTWMVVSLTTAKFKLLIFSTSGFTLSHATNIFVLMILCDFCLLPGQFYHTIVYIRKVENRVQIGDRCAPWKISNCAKKKLFCCRCNLGHRCTWFHPTFILLSISLQLMSHYWGFRILVCYVIDSAAL
jgi:hypothetical protein